MRTAEIITNSGPAYIKAMGGPQGNDPLVCEWIGTSLARWFGLPTFDFAILNLIDGDEVLFYDKGKAEPGPAFVARAVEDGEQWGGSDTQLTLLDNPEAISWLVVLDTWLRNYDRHPPCGMAFQSPRPDNVFLAGEGAGPGRWRLVAMDFSHCIVTPHEAELTPDVAAHDRITDTELYGLFPEFESRLVREELEAARQRLREVSEAVVGPIIEQIPPEWGVGPTVRAALKQFLSTRAAFVADTSVGELLLRCQ